jgi:putative mRNA 3-end processing factor
MQELLILNDRGLYCPQGDFYIDPWQPVKRAVITHAHGDHARPGSASYLATSSGIELLKLRLGADLDIQTLPYGESLDLNGIQLSLHPAGHILGSAQVRLEYRGRVAVVSGDYKLQADKTCASFEPLGCQLMVTESTFGLPVFRWRATETAISEINHWWRENQSLGRTCILYVYSLGKAQRILTEIDTSVGPILLHGAVERVTAVYRHAGIPLPPTLYASVETAREYRGQALVLAPPSAIHSPWVRKFGDVSTAIASGWMQIRGMRRRRAVDRGFVLSDHADWEGLQTAIHQTGAERVLVTHGYASILARWLTESGIAAEPLSTPYEGEAAEIDNRESSETGSQASFDHEPAVETDQST